MVTITELLQLAGYALGSLGGLLLFIEMFQLPSYVSYQEEFGNYDIATLPQEATEYTLIGRLGAFALALGFALLFVATLIG